MPNYHITSIEETLSNFHTNAEHGQRAVLTDNGEVWAWKNDDDTKTYLGAAQGWTTDGSTFAGYSDNDFGELTLHDDLLIDEYIRRSLTSDDYIRVQNDSWTIAAGGNLSLVVEDDQIYTGVKSHGINTTPNANWGAAIDTVVEFGDATGTNPSVVADAAVFNYLYNAYIDDVGYKYTTSNYAWSIYNLNESMTIDYADVSSVGLPVTFSNIITFKADTGAIGIGEDPADWGDVNAVQWPASSSRHSSISSISGNLYLNNNNLYDKTSVRWEYSTSTDAARILLAQSEIKTLIYPSGTAGNQLSDAAAGGNIFTISENRYNLNSLDVDHAFYTLNNANTFFIEGSTGRLGHNTSTPFLNVGSASGDFTGTGLHLHGKGETPLSLILEGSGASPVIVLCEEAGATDDKMMGYTVGSGIAKFYSLDDDTTTNVDNILTMDLGSGNVGIGTDTPGEKVDIRGNMSVLAANGVRDNDWVGEFYNREETDDRSFGVLIQAGSTTSDKALLIQDHDGANTLMTLLGNGYAGIGTGTPTQILSIGEKVAFFYRGSGISAEAGMCVKYTNKSGSTLTQGQLVIADTTTDDAVDLSGADEDEVIGVVLDAAGIANDADGWIAVSGTVDVAMKDNTAATRGYWVKASSEAGYADATSAGPPGLNIAHFYEIGHCNESVSAGGAGTHILARCTLHFN